MAINFGISDIDNLLKSDLKNLKIENRQFSIFGYNTYFHHKRLKDLKKSKKVISKERALFPTMNPNMFSGLPSIFSCKPRLRVCLNPGDVIFCFPNKSVNMEDYFIKIKGDMPPKRCITLVMILIKKIDLKHAYELLRFKACNIARNLIKDIECEYMTFAPDLKQVGDITAKFVNGKWEYAGYDKDPHFHDDNTTIKSLNEGKCKYTQYLSGLTENEKPFSQKGCKGLSCEFYNGECNMSPGNWKYDILFKWGLLGSLKKTMPSEFRSFYLGSKGWSLEEFTDRIGTPKLLKNPRWHKREILNKNGPEILQNLRKEFNIK